MTKISVGTPQELQNILNNSTQPSQTNQVFTPLLSFNYQNIPTAQNLPTQDESKFNSDGSGRTVKVQNTKKFVFTEKAEN